MKKKACYIAIIIGLLAVYFAISKAQTGTDLIYAVPAAVIGCIFAAIGWRTARQIKARERYAARRRAINRVKYREGLHNAEKSHDLQS
jgi:heme O synthase-like polyprenyltransferase